MAYDNEPYISEEQRQTFDLLVKLSDTINDEITKKRNNAIETLMNENLMVSKKKNILKDYVQARVYFESQKISIEKVDYTYNEIHILAKKLFDDNTFFGNDSPYVMNGLAFYENSISFEDIIIAFHNYRLGHEKEDLWWLSLLLCRYIYTVLSMKSIYKEVSFESTDSYNELKRLVKYVDDFWNQYLKDAEVETYKLIDDNKKDFYDKIDYDAGHCFALEDAEDEAERKQIDAEYAAELVHQCSKSLYLLMSTIKEAKELEFSAELKKLRKDVMDVCDNIYSDDEDSYGELEKDNRLNSDGMELLEKNNEIRLLKSILQSALDKLKGCNTEATLIKRQETLQTVKLVDVDSEELVEDFVKKYSNLLMQSISGSLDTYYERLRLELGNKYDLLPEAALNALASAEYLYDMFVRKRAPEGFDYSGIAVLYFQAFETAYDKLLIEPYSDWLKEQRIDKLYEERFRLRNKKPKNRTQEEKNCLDEIENKILNQYFSKGFGKDFFYNKSERTFVICLEIGKFQHFIDLSSCLVEKVDGQASQLVRFLELNCFKKKIDPVLINYFAQAVKNAITPRNNAAHGLHGLKEIDVKEDKAIIYDETNLKDILNFKNLLYAFLDFFD